MGQVLEKMVKPWWLSPPFFTGVLAFVGTGALGWVFFTWYTERILLGWLDAICP